MKTKILVCLGALLAVAALDGVKTRLEMPRAKLTIKVLDEDGAPLRDAKVTLTFMDPATRKGIPIQGLTNVEGLFSGEGQTDGVMGGMVEKDGYYRSGFPFKQFNALTNGRWEPWDATYVTNLRLILRPVALCAKRVRTNVPALDKPCGYDLEKGDWVAPFGKGEKADFSFTVHRDYHDWFNFTVDGSMAFAGRLDGLLPMESPTIGRFSRFRWERESPASGFVPNHTIRFVNRDPKSGKKPEISFDMTKEREHGYFFRVRTIEQNGQVIRGNYGKIVGDIGIDPRESNTATITFTYYFNPAASDRNLEWDPKKNLLAGLAREETPRDP